VIRAAAVIVQDACAAVLAPPCCGALGKRDQVGRTSLHKTCDSEANATAVSVKKILHVRLR
jgi:hypothetical protein